MQHRQFSDLPWRNSPRPVCYDAPTVCGPGQLRLKIYIQQPLLRDVGVYLVCRQFPVTGQFLHDFKVRSAVERMGGEGVAQRVGAGRPWSSG